MKSNEELRKLSLVELQEELLSTRKHQFQLRLNQASGKTKPHLITLIRKAVARIKTIMTEKVGTSNDK